MTDIKNLIKRAYLTLPDADNEQFTRAQCEYFGKTTFTETIYPYGLYANAPPGSLLLLFQVNGQEENLVGIPYNPLNRFDSLKPGEVVVGNPATGSYVKFDLEGNIEVISKKDIKANIEGKCDITCAQDATIKAPNINLVGNVHVTGTITTSGIANFGGTGAAAIARVGDKVTVGGVEGEITTGGTGKST